MILHIVDVEVVADHHLALLFDDGSAKTVNVRPLLHGPIFQPLQDAAYFARVSLDPIAGTVTWPNGADFAPEALHALPSEDHVRPAAAPSGEAPV